MDAGRGTEHRALTDPDHGPEWPEAVYGATGVDRYDADPNPFIMALPPILDELQASKAMGNVVVATEEQRAKPGHIRQHELGAIEDFFQPLDDHIDLHQRISAMLRAGYVRRNPTRVSYLRELKAVLKELDRLAAGGSAPTPPGKPHGASGSSLVLLGLSGVGKSAAVEAVMRTYPQVIRHPSLAGPLMSTSQVVWLRVVCPEDASQKGLLIAVIEALDRLLGTDWWHVYCGRAATVASLRTALARLAFLYGLGILVVDEVQHLNNAKAGGAQVMVDFFKILSDVLGVPLLMVGTEEAEKTLSGTFQSARRHSGLPLFGPVPLYVRGEDGSPEINQTYCFFYQSMFHAQYLRDPIKKVDDRLLSQLHHLTAGVRGIDVKLFWLTQLRALAIGAERLTIELFRSVYDDCFRPLHESLAELGKALKSNGPGSHPTDWSKKYQVFTSGAAAAEEAARAASSLPGPEATDAGPETAVKAARPRRKVRGRPGVRSGTAEPDTDVRLDPTATIMDIVAVGTKAGMSGYESLKRAGLVRALGEEVIRGA